MATTVRPSTSGRSVKDGNWVTAVLEGRGVGHEVGIATLELDRKICYITQLTDSQTFVKTIHTLTSRYPSTILVPSTAAKPGQNSEAQLMNLVNGTIFMECLTESFDDVTFTPVARKYWNEQAGLDFIIQYGADDESNRASAKTAESKYYALSATSALFKYLEVSLGITYPAKSLNIKYSALEGTALIDVDTVISLELVTNLVDPKSKQTLLGLLDHCFTPMATRLVRLSRHLDLNDIFPQLRANILSPSTSTETIEARLDVVEELVGKEERFIAIRKSLSTLKNIDLDKLVGSLITSRSPSPILRVKQDPATLAGQKIQRFLNLKTFLRALPLLAKSLSGCRSHLLTMIKTILQHQKTGDMLKSIDDILSDEKEASTWRYAAFGKNQKIRAVKPKKNLLLDVARETYNENVTDCFELAEKLSQAHKFEIALQYSKNGYQFVSKNEDIDDRRVLEKLGFKDISKKAGKTYFSSLELVALLYIMAQIGSFVPAEYASFAVVSSILSRLSNDDSIESGLSTFAMEMKSMSLILSALEVCKEDGKMLVIVDELGRGTSSAEGIGIAHAIAERIIESTAICFFITHFRELCTTLHAYPTVVTLQMSCEVDSNCAHTACGLRFLHTIKDGASDHVHYGIELARGTRLPQSVLNRAIDIAQRLDELAGEDQRTSKSVMVIERRREVLELVETLRRIHRETPASFSAQELKVMLIQLQKKAVNELEKYLDEYSE
ncbi:hypothetical protein BT69DRAFT_1346041 [Atractiella rhizophila]|nr:hypothetical protein BT69DRAFT_1346041 [Atractiella rhizophila]